MKAWHDMKAIESFHKKCQRRILGIRWHDFVRNSEVSLYALVSHLCPTGLPEVAMPYSDMWQDCQTNTPAHQAMLSQVEVSVGRPPDATWKRPPGRPRTKWTDQLRRDNNNVPTATLWRQANPPTVILTFTSITHSLSFQAKKPCFSANPSHHSPSLFFFGIYGFPRLFTVISEHICFLPLVFLFLQFLVVGSVR